MLQASFSLLTFIASLTFTRYDLNKHLFLPRLLPFMLPRRMSYTPIRNDFPQGSSPNRLPFFGSRAHAYSFYGIYSTVSEISSFSILAAGSLLHWWYTIMALQVRVPYWVFFIYSLFSMFNILGKT